MCIHLGGPGWWWGAWGLGAGSVSPGGEFQTNPVATGRGYSSWERGDSQTIIKDGGQRNCLFFFSQEMGVGKDGRKEHFFPCGNSSLRSWLAIYPLNQCLRKHWSLPESCSEALLHASAHPEVGRCGSLISCLMWQRHRSGAQQRQGESEGGNTGPNFRKD